MLFGLRAARRSVRRDGAARERGHSPLLSPCAPAHTVFRTDVAFSSKLSLGTRIQYDNVSEVMGINLRLHWVPEAGREGFFVVNHNLEDYDFDNRFHSALSEASVRFSYTFRF